MTTRIRIVLLVCLAFVLQVAFFPAHFADPFKPNLLIMFVVYFGFRENILWGGAGSFLLGLFQDAVSGLYFGLNSFSFLLIFTILKGVSHRLYTDSRLLLVLGVFVASIFNGFLNFLMLAVFSLAEGMLSTVLSVMIPQGLVNALIACLAFCIIPYGRREEIP